ncbi:MAG: hypothetical protein HC924_16495 [Synechococcaceae cyanobacterium SM2_3_2]|nr:hypothetical protein [Synechococcaceae cyanobacterium SM2_3_2]
MNDRNQEQQIARAAGIGAGALLGSIFGPVGTVGGAALGYWVAENLTNPELRLPGRSIPVNPFFLVLVTRVSASKNIDQLPLIYPLNIDSCEILFQNSKYMWKGAKSAFENQFLGLIQGKNVELADPNDEYAFRLIAIQVGKDLPGLDKNTNPLSRRDAFMELAGKAKIVAVSPPLLSDSFEQKGFYKLV